MSLESAPAGIYSSLEIGQPEGVIHTLYIWGRVRPKDLFSDITLKLFTESSPLFLVWRTLLLK